MFSYGLLYKQHLILLGIDTSFYYGLVGFILMNVLQFSFQKPCNWVEPLKDKDEMAECQVS